MNMDLTRCNAISKALKVGTGFCRDDLAENLYPL